MSEKTKKINRILIAGTHSGSGKTTVTCGILRALQNRKMEVHAFKCGPDYIDPMFHTKVIGTNSRNIDMFLCSREVATSLFVKNSQDARVAEHSISVVEGVMGYYDGLGGNTTINSTCDIANELKIPSILVVDCKGASISVVAMIKGYQSYKENQIVGVILNKVSKMMLPFYREMIERETGLEVLGCLPLEPEAVIGSRHLGLITAEEIVDLNKKIDLLGRLVEENINLERLIEIGRQTPELIVEETKHIPNQRNINIAIARDKAFCFYYEDGLQTLEEMGVNLKYFSPLEDKTLPENIHGILLGGGYPEIYLEQLSQNQTMKESIRNAHKKGMPIYGECGGFMYLGKTIEGKEMCGIIDMESVMTKRLQNFGYATLTPLKPNLSFTQPVPAHEFHYSKSDITEFAYEAKKSTGKTWMAGYDRDHVMAQYPHLHFSGAVEVAENFVKKCRDYQRETEVQ